jgi:amino-acid N-acetyltransferase
MAEMKEWVSWFRGASPYINSQRNQVVVLALSGEALQHENLDNIIHDIALLNSLGIRLVIVFGARPQIDNALASNELQSEFYQELRITEPHMMPIVLDAYGRLRSELEAKLSMGIINSPMDGAKIRVVSGNFVMAKPHGVTDGVDMGLTGHVRSIDDESIRQHLVNDSVVLIPSTGFSMSGDIFNLSYEELAGDVAIQLQADKIIFFGNSTGLCDDKGALLQQLTVAEAIQFSSQSSLVETSLLMAAARACKQGVTRAHLLSYTHDGALLEELFTRDGHGTMVSMDNFDQIRPARLEDTNGILQLIEPLEAEGFLVRRSREMLETELDYFLVEVRDNAVIACVGLYPFPNDQAAELSCFAVAPHYRKKGRGDRLLEAVTVRAKNQNLSRLFVLTTKTEQWFKERGFSLSSADALPGSKNYNASRNAKVLVKTI